MINSNIGYIICESTSEPLGTVVTPKELNGKVIAECILQTADERNRNGRYYAEEELFPQITAPRTVELLESGTLKAGPITMCISSFIMVVTKCASDEEKWLDTNILGPFGRGQLNQV